LRGLRAGYDAARAKLPPVALTEPKKRAALTLATLEQEVVATIPLAAQPIVTEGVRRLVPYQSAAYARLYLDRLKPIAEADATCGAQGSLLKETARHLAVRMSYEDVVRVAQAKISPERMQRIARDELRVKNEPYSVHDFLKPGIEELCQLLPPFLARPILRVSERRGWLGKIYFGMEINSTSISGYLRFLFLAKLRGLRPYGHRYAQEQAQIQSWLGMIADAARLSAELALEIAECARLIKGYGDTFARGLGNFHLIEARLIRPALAGQIPPARAADAVASARTAALVDPDGESLATCLAAVDGPAYRIAAE
jgi:indolepyruvate ferredoxin oxidoreductase beta subunit